MKTVAQLIGLVIVLFMLGVALVIDFGIKVFHALKDLIRPEKPAHKQA